jgi:SDR family mycofactocin-dependent oxidoreductase
MGRLDGKVAFITGAAHGQGKAHAIRLAQEGADIIGIDICSQMDVVPYPMGTEAELQQTAKEVEALGRRAVFRVADVRDVESLQAAYDAGVAELGPVQIAIANAGIGPGGMSTPQQQWDDVVAVNLTGVWNTGRVVLEPMVKGGKGGAFVLTSSTGGLFGPATNEAGMLGYNAAKHGVIGLMRSWANYGAPHSVRVNALAPTTVKTPMANMGDLEHLRELAPATYRTLENPMPVFAVDPEDIAAAAAWLVSDEARYVTGTVIPVDAGAVNKR